MTIFERTGGLLAALVVAVAVGVLALTACSNDSSDDGVFGSGECFYYGGSEQCSTTPEATTERMTRSDSYAGLTEEEVWDEAERLWSAGGGRGSGLPYHEQGEVDGHDAWFMRDFGAVETDICLWLWDSRHRWETCSGEGHVRDEFERYARLWPILKAARQIEAKLCPGPAHTAAELARRRPIVHAFVKRHAGAEGLAEVTAVLRKDCLGSPAG